MRLPASCTCSLILRGTTTSSRPAALAFSRSNPTTTSLRTSSFFRQPANARLLSSTPVRRNDGAGSSGSSRNKAAMGAFTFRAGALFAITGLGLYVYFQSEKAKVEERKRQETATAKIGRPKIGGPFVLTDQNGNEFTDRDLLGKWSLVYFGFTNCPDICPEELDKMGIVVNDISTKMKTDILPVFITCDPARDSVAAVKTYVKDFIPSLVGLTGTYEDIKKTCKAFRVYFSTPPNAKPTDDYLVDHSIFFYLMDPKGKFVDAFGRSMGPQEVEGKITNYLKDWDQGGGKGSWSEYE